MCSTHSHPNELTGNEFILELIKCPICLDTFTDPRMLPCQHSFCLSCLEHLADNDGRWGRCPQCRQLFRIPFNGVGSFDVNRTISQLLDTFPKKQNEKPALVAKCSGCRKEDLITTCDHCKEALCKPCRIEHFTDMKSSITDQIAKISTETEKFIDKEIEYIKKHEANLNNCKEIRQSIQNKVNEIISRLKNEEAKLLDDVDEFERKETDFLGDKQERLTSLESMNDFSFASNKILSVKSETDKEVMDINEKCAKFIESLNGFSTSLTLRYTSRQVNFVSLRPGINPDNIYSIGYVETVTEEEETGVKTMDEAEHGVEHVEEHVEEHLGESAGKSVDKSEALFADSFLSGNELVAEEKYETLEMHVKTPNRPRSKSSSFLCKKSKSHTNVEKANKSISKQKNKSIVEPRKFFQGYKIIGGEGEDTSEFKHPLGIAVSPLNGHIYVADSWNNRIQVFDEVGVFTKSIEKIDQTDLHYPYSIHIDKKGRIYVSDQSLVRIKVLDSNFNLIRAIGSYGRGIGCYSGLCDISTDEKDNIYVCDSGNHRILKFSEYGDFISQWGSNGSEDGQFKCPACVTVHGDRVIVSDWGNNRVQIFTLNGEYLNQIGKQGNGPSEFQRPLGVAIDEKGNIAIVDEGNNRLQIFKSDFSYHSKISGLKCDFQRPWDVAITKQGGIVVSEYYGHRLQIL